MKYIQIKHTNIFKHKERLEYVLEFLNQHPLNQSFIFGTLERTDAFLVIDYGGEEGDFSMVCQNIFFSNDNIETTHWYANAYVIGKERLYAVEKEQRDVQSLINDRKIGFDFFETIFFHIARYEEVFCKASEKSQAGWLKEEEHFLIRYGLEVRPLVDELVRVFFELLQKTEIKYKTTYDLSHDVDILTRFSPFSKWVKSMGATVLYRRGWQHFFQSIAYYWAMIRGEKRDPYDSFDYLFRNESIWQQQVVYLMSGGNTKYDNKYHLSDERLDKIIDEAIKKGYSVGLHPSYNAGFNPAMYQSEKKALEEKLQQEIVLNRQHWLRYDWDVTPAILTEHGIKADSSMGYNRYLGFRCGTGFPYYMYDFKKEQAFVWKEHPMAFMESSAIHQARQTGQALDVIMSDFLEKNKLGTHISFNFHNSNFDPLLDTGKTLIHFYKNELIKILGGH